jgi:hypothetical protein
MKTFLKGVLLVIVALLAVKFLPLIFALGCLLAAAVIGLLAIGASAIAALLGSAIVLAAVLSPVWVPVLAIIGIIALVKRSSRRSAGLVA